MKINLTFLFLIIFLISCKNETQKKIDSRNKQIESQQYQSEIKVDTLYKLLENAITKDTLEFSNQEQFLFINAWNEWAEGNYLEPDRVWRRGWLEAVRSASASRISGGSQSLAS